MPWRAKKPAFSARARGIDLLESANDSAVNSVFVDGDSRLDVREQGADGMIRLRNKAVRQSMGIWIIDPWRHLDGVFKLSCVALAGLRAENNPALGEQVPVRGQDRPDLVTRTGCTHQSSRFLNGRVQLFWLSASGHLYPPSSQR